MTTTTATAVGAGVFFYNSKYMFYSHIQQLSHAYLLCTLQQYNYTDVSVFVDSCSSRYLAVWAGLLYAYKTCILLAGLYFTWQTRHVTLPSLNDTRRQYIVIYNVIAMATLVLPVLFSQCTVGGASRCGVAGLAIWLTLVVTVTLMFVPKVRWFKVMVFVNM